MTNPTIALQIQTLPDNPGVYQYYDKEGKILYVGKAKNLKKRVSSYFNKIHDTAKTNVLVKKIVTIKHIVVPTETDALLLENNLIKTLQPRYNVLLRDDKSYPWLCIKKEPFSRIFSTRRMVKDGSEYFGPYTSFKTVNTILELIKELYPLRTCNYDLSQSNIDSGKFKVCLEYHIGNCKGPCEGYETLENYQNIDVVIPVPLHKKKQRKRGFNQVAKFGQQLAKNLDAVYLDDVLVKVTNTTSQTTKKRLTRWINNDELFAIKNTASIENKHILLVDDLITTGATLEACITVLNKAKNIKISVATMAIA